jgi:hypothetical protein
MHAIINQELGRVHHSAGNPDLTKTRPVYAFIPEGFFTEAGFQKSRYLSSRWPSINCSANALALGSHVIPDPERPVNQRSRCPILVEFLLGLEAIAAVKEFTTA